MRSYIVLSTDLDLQCDFCASTESRFLYTPTGTRRGVNVWCCSNCGLVQSNFSRKEESKVRTLSTDADWGNVRHGKGVRFDHLKGLIKKYVDLGAIKNIVDIGSNRGDFVKWAKIEMPKATIIAIEPDGSVIDTYKNLDGIQVYIEKSEKVSLESEKTDLIFNSHTLEHAKSASAMLKQMYDAMKFGAYAILEVPNLEVISTDGVIEEYFIDKHTFHFDRGVLIDYVIQMGFEVLGGLQDVDKLNLTLVLKKINLSKPYEPIDGIVRAKQNIGWLKEYPHKLQKNRIFLKEIVSQKLKPLGLRQKVAFWGAGRIFDTLIKYGNLESSDVYCLVDRYLAGIVDHTHGIEIRRPEYLRLLEPNVVVILGVSAEANMASEAYKMGIRHVLKFSELMDQVKG
jgi:hypothetical protein